MLDCMRALQEKFLPMPDRDEELEEAESIYQELRERSGPRLRCLMDKQRALRKMIAGDNFRVGFKLGWMVARALGDVTDDGKTQTVRRRHGAQARRRTLGRAHRG